MDKSNYAMARFGLESKDTLYSKQKSCWSYLKYFFFFTSVIQSLIILGLVLFMVYGNPQAGNELQLQEMQSQKLEMHDLILHQNDEKINLTHIINVTAKEASQAKQLYEKAMVTTRSFNQSNQALRAENMQCKTFARQCQVAITTASKYKEQLNMMNMTCFAEKLHLREERNHLELAHHFARENCTRNTERLARKAEEADTDKEKYHMDMIAMRKEKIVLAEQLAILKTSCSTIEDKFQAELQNLKQSFNHALQRALSSPASSAFEAGNGAALSDTQLSQSCKSLSIEIDRQVKGALAGINTKVAAAMTENSQLKAERGQSKEQLDECEKNKELAKREKEHVLHRLQASCDVDATRAYEEKEKLKREKEEQRRQLAEKEQVLHMTQAQLTAKIRELERCSKTPGFSSNISPVQGHPGGSQNFNDLNEQINRFLG